MIGQNRSKNNGQPGIPTLNEKKIMKKINSLTTILSVMTLTLWSGAVRAQTPFYSVNGTGGTGGGSSSISVTPSIAPIGSTALTDLGLTANLSFGIGPDGVVGESLVNAATGQSGSQVLAGTLGASSSLSAFTLTMWIDITTATPNNFRILEIASGSPATTGSSDGASTPGLFFGLNSGGGLQAYVNGNNGNSVPTSIAAASSWNNGGTLGSLAANTWYFEAITYDSVGGNFLLYSGNQTNSAIQAASYTTLGGALNLSSATSIALLDRFSGGRNFPGAIDDVNLYSGALTQAQLDAIQVAEVPSIPEPGTLALIGLGLGSLAATMRRRQVGK
jgi:hypothetical protein